MIAKHLRSVIQPILVRVLTHNGLEYWAKELTFTCYRHSTELYYTVGFAYLFLSLLLTYEARIKKCIDKLYYKLGDSSLAAGIFPSNREVWNDIADDITNHNVVVNKIVNLRKIAAAAK